MSHPTIVQRITQWLAIVAMLGFGLAMAQSEPTMNQVYEMARAGRLEQAQTMMQQVLVANPNSAKAHFVYAELSARMGQAGRAQASLATAEKLAPGLPFAKPEAVQALRAQLASARSVPAARGAERRVVETGAPAAPFPWGTVLLVGGGVLALGVFMLRKKQQANVAQNTYASPAAMQGGLNGPQTFGAGMGGGVAGQGLGVGQGYGQPGYGQPGVGQAPAPGTGMGGRVMGGLATGLAVGAGVMAAQAIGKNLMGNDAQAQGQPDAAQGNSFEALPGNTDMGGQNFGISDAGAWDDGGSLGDSGDSGEW